MSARARFLVPLLWAVKMESLVDFDGRGRPVLGVLEGAERREERVDVKARLLALAGGVSWTTWRGDGRRGMSLMS